MMTPRKQNKFPHSHPLPYAGGKTCTPFARVHRNYFARSPRDRSCEGNQKLTVAWNPGLLVPSRLEPQQDGRGDQKRHANQGAAADPVHVFLSRWVGVASCHANQAFQNRNCLGERGEISFPRKSGAKNLPSSVASSSNSPTTSSRASGSQIVSGNWAASAPNGRPILSSRAGASPAPGRCSPSMRKCWAEGRVV